jgi:predicted CopG family antitoxin
MAHKVTISVPDELYEKMAQWRSSFNFSRVFQRTIAGLIQSKEEFQKKLMQDFDLSAVVERLKKEKQETEHSYLEKGKKDALEWLKTAHYKDILYALKWVPGDEPARDETLGDYFAQRLKQVYRAGLTEMSSQTFRVNQAVKKYISGWKEGVQEFWNAVKDEIHSKESTAAE